MKTVGNFKQKARFLCKSCNHLMTHTLTKYTRRRTYSLTIMNHPQSFMHQQQPSLVNQTDGYQTKSHHNIWKIAVLVWEPSPTAAPCSSYTDTPANTQHNNSTINSRILFLLISGNVFYWETTHKHSAKKSCFS